MNIGDDKLRERVERIKTPLGDVLFRFQIWLSFMIGQTDKETFLIFLPCCDTNFAPWDYWTVFLLSSPYGDKYKTITRYISWLKRPENNYYLQTQKHEQTINY